MQKRLRLRTWTNLICLRVGRVNCFLCSFQGFALLTEYHPHQFVCYIHPLGVRLVHPARLPGEWQWPWLVSFRLQIVLAKSLAIRDRRHRHRVSPGDIESERGQVQLADDGETLLSCHKIVMNLN